MRAVLALGLIACGSSKGGRQEHATTASIERLEVLWPGGGISTFQDVPADRRVVVHR